MHYSLKLSSSLSETKLKNRINAIATHFGLCAKDLGITNVNAKRSRNSSKVEFQYNRFWNTFFIGLDDDFNININVTQIHKDIGKNLLVEVFCKALCAEPLPVVGDPKKSSTKENTDSPRVLSTTTK